MENSMKHFNQVYKGLFIKMLNILLVFFRDLKTFQFSLMHFKEKNTQLQTNALMFVCLSINIHYRVLVVGGIERYRMETEKGGQF